jgi:hypothetical protein
LSHSSDFVFHLDKISRYSFVCSRDGVEATMMHTIRKLFAVLSRRQTAVEKYLQRHEAWDRDCRARGMTAREQADELQIRCAWVRLRRKASVATMRRPSNYLEILERAAREEARTLTVIGGNELASVFWQTFHATNPLEILAPEAASVVRACARRHPASNARTIVPSAIEERDAPTRSRKALTRTFA